MNSVMAENRGSCRYAAVQSSVFLGWWEEPEFRTHAAELKNLSHGGVLLTSPAPPPDDPGAELWLCMSSAAEWAPVSLVSVTPELDGYYHVRLRFNESCPYEMFNLAVHGISVGG